MRWTGLLPAQLEGAAKGDDGDHSAALRIYVAKFCVERRP
jgi:hypothetical protein